MNFSLVAKNPSETKSLALNLAHEILKLPEQKKSFVMGLSGELGAGKTCFLQGFAAGLGIKEKILSPTFVLFKRFAIDGKSFKNFYHFDCYRIKSPKEILNLDFRKIVSDPENIVAIEWPEKIKPILPKKILNIKFTFVDENKRKITINAGRAISHN